MRPWAATPTLLGTPPTSMVSGWLASFAAQSQHQVRFPAEPCERASRPLDSSTSQTLLAFTQDASSSGLDVFDQEPAWA